jgi:hypothetical protein
VEIIPKYQHSKILNVIIHFVENELIINEHAEDATLVIDDKFILVQMS